MCGLSGVMSNNISYNEEAMFKDLLNVSSLRGTEGSGCIISQASVFKRNPAIRAIRTRQISGTLAYSDELDQLLKGRVNCLIGHARWPTKGGVDISAVHPHRSGHIIGVHNGTMNRVGGEDVKAGQSDSAMLFESFAKNGVKETIKESDGAYCLIWIDEKDQTINFLRNGLRTLFFRNYGWNKNINTMYWASEREMLDFVAPRHYKNDTSWNTYLPVDKWFKYPLEVAHMILCEETIHDVRPAAKVYSTGGATARGKGGADTTGLIESTDETDADRDWVTRVWDAEEQRFCSPSYIQMRNERTARRLGDPKTRDMVERYRERQAALRLEREAIDRQATLLHNNVRLLPAPRQETAIIPEKSTTVDTSFTQAQSEATEINTEGMSKKQKARLAKRRAQEEAAAKKKVNRFRSAAPTVDITEALSEFVSEVPEDDADQTPTNTSGMPDDDLSDLWGHDPHRARRTPHRDFRADAVEGFAKVEGEGCAWCGTVACVGDRVLPTGYSDLGGGHLCYDCSRNPDVSPYVQGKQLKTVSL